MMHRLALRPSLQICSRHRHRPFQRHAVAHQHHAAVVSHVQPLMRIRRPRIRHLQSARQRVILRRNTRPQSKRAVHMHPCARILGALANLLRRIKRPRIHIPCLNTNHAPRRNLGQLLQTHPPLRVRRHARHAIFSKSHHAQRLLHRRVILLAHNHLNRRRAKHSIALHIPSFARQQRRPRRRQSTKICGRRARHKSAVAFRRQSQRVANPPQYDVFKLRRHRRHHAQRHVLIPGTRQPIRRHRRRQRPSNHKSKITPARRSHRCRTPHVIQHLHYASRLCWPLRQFLPKTRQPRQRLRSRRHPSLSHSLDIPRSPLRRHPQQFPHLAHSVSLFSVSSVHSASVLSVLILVLFSLLRVPVLPLAHSVSLFSVSSVHSASVLSVLILVLFFLLCVPVLPLC